MKAFANPNDAMLENSMYIVVICVDSNKLRPSTETVAGLKRTKVSLPSS